MGLKVVPVTLGRAKEFIAVHHRHNKPPIGAAFCVGVEDDSGTLVGVAVAARPASRFQDDGVTLDVKRCCTDGTPNSISMLYGACRRAAKALGWHKLITYTLESEPGTSLKASGWTLAHVGRPNVGQKYAPFAAANTRLKPRTDIFGDTWQPEDAKQRWEIDLR